MTPDRLYFVTRSDLSEGRRAAQLVHAMDEWAAEHGPQQGTVIVYEVPTEQDLLLVWAHVLEQDAPSVMFREPDLGHAATAMATAHGPMDLPLLGSALAKAKRGWREKALRRARVMEAVMRPVAIDRPSPPTTYDCSQGG
jgi:hypothetical protein